MASSRRASQLKLNAGLPSAVSSATNASSFLPWRLAPQTVNPFWENLRMMALPMASPAPIISATLVFFGMAIDIRWGLYSQGYVYRD